MTAHFKRLKIALCTIGFLILYFSFLLLNKVWSNYCFQNGAIISESELAANEALCETALRIRRQRQERQTLHLDPNKEITDELLEFIVNRPLLCRIPKANGLDRNNSSKKLLVAIVETARANFFERQLIRNTWGSIKEYKSWHVRTLFVIGLSAHCISPETICPATKQLLEKEEADLLTEQGLHGDIVVGAFADSYRNLTYKTLLGYKFVVENCPDADLVIKADDDIFVDIPKILDLRENDLAQNSKLESPTPDFYCRYVSSAYVVRSIIWGDSKYIVSRDEWSEDEYPPYCLGSGYIISAKYLGYIYSVRHSAGFFAMEDVLTTGRLPQIVEQTIGPKAVVRNLTPNITARTEAYLYRKYCRKMERDFERKFGLIVYLVRESWDFERNMWCLWERTQRTTQEIY